MFGFAFGVAARTHYFLRRFLPTNILLDALHTRRGLKWGVPAMLLAVPYALMAVFCTGLVETDGPGWLSALALLFVWNALKFLIAGPVTFVQLIRARALHHAAPKVLSKAICDTHGRAQAAAFASTRRDKPYPRAKLQHLRNESE